MSESRLFNVLKLAYSPLSNYDFTIVKDDEIIKKYINSAKLYLIAQRPVMTMEHFWIDNEDLDNLIARFEIHQQGNDAKLVCAVPLFQEGFEIPPGSQSKIAINYIYPKSQSDVQEEMPFTMMANFVIANSGGEFFWLSPEKLIYHHLRGALDIRIEGDVEAFLNYHVHYIGKATEQDVVSRLTGHSHLQDVLSVERPFHYGNLPTDEIVLLLFSFEENVFMNTISEDDDTASAVKILMGEEPIDRNTIYLDAEKALINALQPKHNKLLYKNYPVSKDGLHGHGLELYTFTFMDPIVLKYDNKEIVGRTDTLVVEKGKDLQIKRTGGLGNWGI